jgi:hypothetical protein
MEVGLVDRGVPAGELDEAVNALAAALMASSPRVLAQGKRAFRERLPLDEEAASVRSTEVLVACARSADARGGIAAFPGEWTPDRDPTVAFLPASARRPSVRTGWNDFDATPPPR